jgi:hypothetical protein
MQVEDKGAIVTAVDKFAGYASIRIAGSIISSLIGLVGIGGLARQILSAEPDNGNIVVFAGMVLQSAFVLPSVFRVKQSEVVLDRSKSELVIVRHGLIRRSRAEKKVYALNRITDVEVTGDIESRHVSLCLQGGERVHLSHVGQPDATAQQLATAIREAAGRHSS